MRIVRYQTRDSKPQFGVVDTDFVHELIGDPLAPFETGRPVARIADIQLLAPCQPSKVVAVAINYQGIEGYSPDMSEPLFFIKPSTSVCGPRTKVFNPFPSLPWWGEAELAVVIRHRLSNATLEEVRSAILGFTIANDVTVENVEGRDHHLARSKCADNFCPIGPWIDTSFDPSDCLIEAIQNGEVIRRARSSQQHWQWQRIVQWLSNWMTLEPWDVISTGNPPDTVGMRFLNHADTYTARVEGLGELTNFFYLQEAHFSA